MLDINTQFYIQLNLLFAQGLIYKMNEYKIQIALDSKIGMPL